MTEIPEIILIDKPKGITSFGVIRELRKKIGVRKIGHAGTLDPLATGLMILGVGKGTKKLNEFIKLDKEYEAEVLLGEKRTTGDMEGEVLEERRVEEAAEILRSKISAALNDMKGELTLPVSAYSAIKVDGVPMYKRAREAAKEGKIIEEVPERKMKIYQADLKEVTVDGGRAVAKIGFKVGSGTYVRSLAEELGRRLGYPAVLKNLRRTKVGKFDIKDAKQLGEF